MTDLSKMKKADLIALIGKLAEETPSEPKTASFANTIRWGKDGGAVLTVDQRPMLAGGEKGTFSKQPRVWLRPIVKGVPVQKGGSRVHIEVLKYLADPANKEAIATLISDQEAFTKQHGGFAADSVE